MIFKLYISSVEFSVGFISLVFAPQNFLGSLELTLTQSTTMNSGSITLTQYRSNNPLAGNVMVPLQTSDTKDFTQICRREEGGLGRTTMAGPKT